MRREREQRGNEKEADELSRERCEENAREQEGRWRWAMGAMREGERARAIEPQRGLQLSVAT